MTVTKKVASTLSHLDHRLIGERQKLFFFDEVSKGSCFFHPRGAYIYNKLIDYLRAEYKKRHYHEVITPNIYDCRLWKTSGHWDHYEEHMIKFKLAEHDFSLKPMNCPGHCLMFKQLGRVKSSQLPIRWADFGALHRNEFSGALLGLSRVRRFQQDDAHIFCTPEQVESEVRGCLDLANHVYREFGFTFNVALSLRPEKYMGDTESWDQAEGSLKQALIKSNLKYTEQQFEGAFYGPKIDLIVKDCHERSQQCATIQLDFQLPQRFDLVYKDEEDNQLKKPVIIHRAIFGSIERFMAMLAEHSGGRWPFWLSPIQAQVIPVHESANNYALALRDTLRNEGFMVECDLDKKAKLSKKIREAQLDRYNFILVVGYKEQETDSVTVRLTLNTKMHQLKCLPVKELIEQFHELNTMRIKDAGRHLLTTFNSHDQQ